MEIKEIAFVCFPVASLKRAQAFYEGTLGLKPTSTWVKADDNGMIEYNVGDSAIALGAGADSFKPGKLGPGVALEVVDFTKAVDELRAKKVKFLMEPLDTSVCHMALIEDPDGNQIMIHHRKADNPSEKPAKKAKK
jgi:catechol 2,3-dioxygenase-like lactoylglutathione lyase family enzyme